MYILCIGTKFVIICVIISYSLFWGNAQSSMHSLNSKKKKLITKNLKAITVLAFLQYVPVWCMTTICNIQNIYIYIIIKYHSIWESLFSLLLCIMFIVIFLLFHFLFSNFTQCWLWLLIFRNNWLNFYV